MFFLTPKLLGLTFRISEKIREYESYFTSDVLPGLLYCNIQVNNSGWVIFQFQTSLRNPCPAQTSLYNLTELVIQDF